MCACVFVCVHACGYVLACVCVCEGITSKQSELRNICRLSTNSVAISPKVFAVFRPLFTVVTNPPRDHQRSTCVTYNNNVLFGIQWVFGHAHCKEGGALHQLLLEELRAIDIPWLRRQSQQGPPTWGSEVKGQNGTLRLEVLNL